MSTTATALALVLALAAGVALAFIVAAEVRGRAVAEPAIGRGDASPATPDDNVAEPLIDLQQRPGVGAAAIAAPTALGDDQREPVIDLQRGMSDADQE